MPADQSPRIEFLDEVGSTNSEALRRAAAGERGPVWLCSTRQTQGRGRAGRSWQDSGHALAASLLFAPSCPVGVAAGLALLAGVAAVDAVRAALPLAAAGRVQLKWPNDVLIGGDKACGILVESCQFPPDLIVIIGIGINMGAAPALQDRSATCLTAHGASISPEALADLLAKAMEHWLAIWQNGQAFAPIREAWLARAIPLGQSISINTGSGPVMGAFAGLDADGGLLMDDGAGTRARYTFGDVALMQ